VERRRCPNPLDVLEQFILRELCIFVNVRGCVAELAVALAVFFVDSFFFVHPSHVCDSFEHLDVVGFGESLEEIDDVATEILGPGVPVVVDSFVDAFMAEFEEASCSRCVDGRADEPWIELLIYILDEPDEE
jgi:hypothetical protein